MVVAVQENLTQAPESQESAGPKIRPVTRPAVSLVELAISSEAAFVPSDGLRTRGYQAVKRQLDVVGSLVLLVMLAPVMALVAAILLCTTQGSPFFFQKRLGYRGKPFWMIKFQTMVAGAEKKQVGVQNEMDGPIFKNRRDPRITPLGALLRSTSLDETPQLINVLLGQMSLVGPRPPIANEVVEYEWWQQRRLSVKPGLTCLWQVSGRSEIGFVDWVRMDLWYVKHQGIWTDLWLLLMTPLAVLARRGAY
jgi:lipopolysaccharide/colanic/teichoic acid biosynthesis glycosyltransferase